MTILAFCLEFPRFSRRQSLFFCRSPPFLFFSREGDGARQKKSRHGSLTMLFTPFLLLLLLAPLARRHTTHKNAEEKHKYLTRIASHGKGVGWHTRRAYSFRCPFPFPLPLLFEKKVCFAFPIVDLLQFLAGGPAGVEWKATAPCPSSPTLPLLLFPLFAQGQYLHTRAEKREGKEEEEWE